MHVWIEMWNVLRGLRIDCGAYRSFTRLTVSFLQQVGQHFGEMAFGGEENPAARMYVLNSMSN